MTAIAHIITDSIYVRGTPHKDGEIVGDMKKGDKAVIVESKTFAGGYTWLRVKLKKGGTGWIYSGAKYVKVESNVPDFEPPEIPIPDTSLAKMVAYGVGVIIVCAIIAWFLK
jgi:hypothetical protein